MEILLLLQVVFNSSEFMLVSPQVQVQRRETERQAQMRLKSHAYISKLEADEEWVDIKFRDLSTDDNVWRKLEGAPEEELPMELTAAEYLTALLPSMHPSSSVAV